LSLLPHRRVWSISYSMVTILENFIDSANIEQLHRNRYYLQTLKNAFKYGKLKTSSQTYMAIKAINTDKYYLETLKK